MSLTMGSGPFGHAPAGRSTPELPHDVVLTEPWERWIRAERRGATVVDSKRVRIVQRTGFLARYAFPREDVALGDDEVRPVDGLEGHVFVDWDAMDRWLEEDFELVAHGIDPYHRVDVRPTSRHVVVSLDGEVLAESRRARLLFETSLPARFYLPAEDVAADLRESPLHTACAYKGVAAYRSWRAHENLAWTYPEPRLEAQPVRDLVAFFDERVDVDVDGERRPRPPTPWGRPGWWAEPGPER